MDIKKSAGGLGMLVMVLTFGLAALGCATKPAVSGDGLFEYTLSASAGGAVTIGGPKGATITNYFGTATDVVIPPEIDGNPVRAIAGGSTFMGNRPGAFEGKSLTSVVLPDSIQFIGNKAFAGNQITNVTIPGDVKIDNSADSEADTSAFAGNPLASLTLGGEIECHSSDSLGTLTLYYLGNGRKPGVYSRDGGAWTYNGSKLELPPILNMGGPIGGGFIFEALDDEKFGSLGVNKYEFDMRRNGSMTTCYWIPTGTHTLRIGEKARSNVGGGLSVSSGTGRSAEIRENFQAGIMYLVKEKPDNTGVVIENQGPYSAQ
ncbi:MAG: leucine-rich repeat domain-containing protein [Treponema sp.]|jgi:hypothetical protein|nr:leucine-rich repeat domain-containing protein [Treponema sp.]